MVHSMTSCMRTAHIQSFNIIHWFRVFSFEQCRFDKKKTHQKDCTRVHDLIHLRNKILLALFARQNERLYMPLTHSRRVFFASKAVSVDSPISHFITSCFFIVRIQPVVSFCVFACVCLLQVQFTHKFIYVIHMERTTKNALQAIP